MIEKEKPEETRKAGAPRRAALRPPSLSMFLRYAAAALVPLLVFSIQRMVLPHPNIAPFVLLFCGVTAVSWLGGRGPGLVAVAISAALGNYFFIEPTPGWILSGPGLVATALFLGSASLIAVLCGSLHDAMEIADERSSQLSKALSDREKAQEGLRHSEERFRSVAEMLPQLVWTCDADGKADYFNTRWLTYSGQGMETGRDLSLDCLAHVDDRTRAAQQWKEALRSASVFQMELRLRSASGKYQWFLARAFPLHDGTSGIVRWFGTCTDIDDLKRAEEALHEANRRKNEFLAVLSHELRNPLAAITNSLYILERASPGGDQARRAQEVIRRQVGQLTRLVNDLLDVTRISRNRIQLQRTQLDLVELARHTLNDYRALFEKEGVRLELAPAAGPVLVEGDANRLEQVLGNLLTNAAKFTPQGGCATVSVSSDPVKSCALLSVADTGAGLTEAMLAHLFEPFMQADSTLDRSKGGLGLGLALVKGLVELHGGEVSVRSHGPGQGCEFVVQLPLALEARPAPRATPGPRAPTRRRLLIIEDNVDAAESLREALSFSGNEVVVACNGPEGLARARECRPEIVLCDIGLPGMDGFEVARAFRADDRLKGTFLVALSGYAQPGDRKLAQEAGFSRHLAKPISLEQLEEVLAEAPLSAQAGSDAGGDPGAGDSARSAGKSMAPESGTP